MFGSGSRREAAATLATALAERAAYLFLEGASGRGDYSPAERHFAEELIGQRLDSPFDRGAATRMDG
jgi:hypothetical protein